MYICGIYQPKVFPAVYQTGNLVDQMMSFKGWTENAVCQKIIMDRLGGEKGIKKGCPLTAFSPRVTGN
ncbi:MAG: hypothetical protein A2W90_15580 [Bacteroidetes bacterium GWF2_42_66]|nr:MAG: hypothetical protein A2W92_08110 [Bacteroidetes bacterium GWA2_42_15]OFY02681.1 MAG: hypothetical protein A2W89_04165 [Bacteroidetes bacterium GWE2_42_39]OFY43880.1 MAG: hypothetical protein A2W90_15580 [Bacteroidetes bacterium GWF2_42_66]HBL77248.1 hypothetical protein [Prolixibacteraceae bacterium]HCR90624.1 hypothetical protein [Prolixibacteraceae bacterium]